MRKYMQWDIYTVLIVAIVPLFLAVAWGLTWNHERVTAAQSCDETEAYLTEVSGIATLYTDAGTVENTDQWLNQMETIQPQGHAWEIHETGMRVIEYVSTTDPDLDTTDAIHDELSVFQSSIDDAYTEIVDNCPDLESLLPTAFPMFFKEQ